MRFDSRSYTHASRVCRVLALCSVLGVGVPYRTVPVLRFVIYVGFYQLQQHRRFGYEDSRYKSFLGLRYKLVDYRTHSF